MSAAAALRARYDEAQPGRWGVADLSILEPGRSRPVPMPGDVFGDLWPLMGDLATGAGAPVDYVALSVLGVAASLIGGKRRIQPFATSPQWREPCILWLAPVGDPASNKSPAIDAAIEPLKGMEAELAELHKSTLMAFQAVAERARAERKEWEGQVKTATKDGVATPPLPAAADDPDEPQRPRLVVQDATPEALGVILAGNPNGTLHLRDELAGWLMSFERYTPTYVFVRAGHLPDMQAIERADVSLHPRFSIFRFYGETVFVRHRALHPFRAGQQDSYVGSLPSFGRAPGKKRGEPFKVGDEVKFTAGPFAGFTGFVETSDGLHTEVTVSLFGRPAKIKARTLHFREPGVLGPASAA